MSCLPVPCLSRCHLLSSAGVFSVSLAASRSGSPDIGAACCPVRSDFRCDPAQTKQAAPGAACWKKDRQPVRALAASSLLRRRDPGAGFSGRRS